MQIFQEKYIWYLPTNVSRICNYRLQFLNRLLNMSNSSWKPVLTQCVPIQNKRAISFLNWLDQYNLVSNILSRTILISDRDISQFLKINSYISSTSWGSHPVDTGLANPICRSWILALFQFASGKIFLFNPSYLITLERFLFFPDYFGIASTS